MDSPIQPPTPPPAQQPAPTPQAAKPDPPASSPGAVWIDSGQYAREQAELQRLRDEARQRQEAQRQAEAERLQSIVKAGQAENALKEIEQNWSKKYGETQAKYDQIANRYLQERVNSAINDALAGRAFAGADPQGTAAMVRSLLAAEIEAVFGDDGEPVVRHKGTMRPAGDHLKERLSAPDSPFAIFFAATNKGGAGGGGNVPASVAASAQDQPLSPAAKANTEFAKAFLARKAAARNAFFS